MLLNSIDYLIFYPIVLLIYFCIPCKKRYIWLLISSYIFYAHWDTRYVLWIGISTISTYICGRFIEKVGNKCIGKGKDIVLKLVLLITLIINLGLLLWFKYFGFFGGIFENILEIFRIDIKVSEFNLFLPVGISYYTFQVIGYTIDIYRGKIKAEKNILKYALYVSFFPKILSGPIEKSTNFLRQIEEPSRFDVDRVREGMLTLLYGLFMKVVAADNIAIVVDQVYANSSNEHGMVLMLATILFAFQIYFDFQGYTFLAIGSAKILGYDLIANFNAPYWALNVREFWQRWHISLTSWFREYIYFSLGGSRKGSFCKYINTMIVFLLSGLWHGAGWKYIVWGGINGLYLVLYDAFIQLKSNEKCKFSLVVSDKANRLIARIMTFVAIDIAWVFFRADSFGTAVSILVKMVSNFNLFYVSSEEFWLIFENVRIFLIIVLSIVMLMFLDYCKYREVDIYGRLRQQNVLVRWMIYFAFIFAILLCGNYGNAYEQTQFIYFQF